MNMLDIMNKLAQLSEAVKDTGKGKIHTAEPGGYGRKDDENDEGKKVKADIVKKGRGRPKKDTDASGEEKKYDTKGLAGVFGGGKAPKSTKKGTVVKGKAQSHASNKDDDGTDVEESKSKKRGLKEYFDQLDRALTEAGLSVQPIPGQKQQQSYLIKDTSNPTSSAITTSDPAVVKAAQTGTLSMQKPGAASSSGATPATGAGSQVAPMEEGGEKWIKGAIKHPGSFSAKAKRAGETTAQYAKEKAHAPGTLGKQARLAQTLSKMHHEDEMEEGLGDVVKKVGGVAKKVGGAVLNKLGHGSDEDLIRDMQKRAGMPQTGKKPMAMSNKEMSEAQSPEYFAQSSPISSNNRSDTFLEGRTKADNKAEKAGKKVTKDLEYDMGHKGKDDAKAEKAGKKVTKDIEYDEKKDKKKKVKEGMEHNLQAARLEGKSHALRKMPYNCTHDDMEEARHYHEGFKEGLDECYGQMPILGRTAVGEMGAGSEVGDMASYGAHTPELDEMDKTAYMKQKAIKTPGNTFKAFGQTMHDNDVLDEFAFEALDNQLNALLESKEDVAEGMTVSISKGQQGAPDSVSVSAQDGEADQLLSIIKQSGLGLFGGEEQNGYGAPQGSTAAPGGIEVVDDHDGMMALMKKLSGQGGEDYADEEGSDEGHDHEHTDESTCNECGMMECECDSGEEGQEQVDEVESEDQMAYKVAEEGEQNPPDNGSANTTNDEQGNAAANQALATADAEENADTKQVNVAEDGEEDDEEDDEEDLEESYANGADDTFEADIAYMTKVISSGLNKEKSTGQTTVPVIAGQGKRTGVSESKQLNESVDDWKKLAGIK